MQRSVKIVRSVTLGLLIGMFLADTMGRQSADVRPTSHDAANSDQGYQLGPEDVLLISVWKDEHLTREVVVRPDGLISFPLVGDVPAEADAALERRDLLGVGRLAGERVAERHAAEALRLEDDDRARVLGGGAQ